MLNEIAFEPAEKNLSIHVYMRSGPGESGEFVYPLFPLVDSPLSSIIVILLRRLFLTIHISNQIRLC